MRIADYFRTAAKDIRRQPVRAILTVTALSISTAIVVTLGSLTLGAQQAIVSALSPDNSLTTIAVTSNKTGGSGLFGSVQVASNQSSKLDDSSVQSLSHIPHVQFASPRSYVWEFNTFSVEGSPKQFVAQTQAVGAESGKTLPLSAGRLFAAGSTAHEVIVGAAYAKALGQTPASLVGKNITIISQKGYRGEGAEIPGPLAWKAASEKFADTTTSITATIVGVTTEGSNQSGLFIPYEWARKVRTTQYWEGLETLKKVDQLADEGYTSIIVQVDETGNVPAVSAAIDSLGLGQVSTLAMVQKLMSFAAVMWLILGAVALVALIAASLGIVNTMLMMVSEQRFAISVWRASGARKGQIAMMFLLQAVVLGIFGGVVGSAIGYFASQLASSKIAELLRAQSVAVTQIAPAPWWLLAGAIGVTIIFAVFAGLYPAFAAARQDPAKALDAV